MYGQVHPFPDVDDERLTEIVDQVMRKIHGMPPPPPRGTTGVRKTPGRENIALSERDTSIATLHRTSGASTSTSSRQTISMLGRASTAKPGSPTSGRASTATPERASTASPGSLSTATGTATPGNASTATPGRASTATSVIEATTSTGRATTPTSVQGRPKPPKKPWNFNPKLDAKERVRTPKKSTERFLSISRPNVSTSAVKSSTSTSGGTVKTSRPKTVGPKGSDKESDKLIVTYVDGIPVVLVESGPNKGKIIKIPQVQRSLEAGVSSRPSTSFNSGPGTKASGIKGAGTKPSGTKAFETKASGAKAPGTKASGTKASTTKAFGTKTSGTKESPAPLDPMSKPTLEPVAGPSKGKPPSPKEPEMSKKHQEALARIEETVKWEEFFKLQSVDALLALCDSARPGDLARIHNALRYKLGMNEEKPWPLAPLPRNFVALLSELTTRTHTETNDEARIAMFRILLDLADRFNPNGLVTFHNDIGLVLCLDQRLHSYRQYNGDLPKHIQDEYRVIMQLKAWLFSTYDAMMVNWVPRTPRPESSMNRNNRDTQYALDKLYSMDNHFTYSDTSEDESDED